MAPETARSLALRLHATTNPRHKTQTTMPKMSQEKLFKRGAPLWPGFGMLPKNTVHPSRCPKRARKSANPLAQ